MNDTYLPTATPHGQLLSLDDVLKLLGERVLVFLAAERCTIFIHDPPKRELWSRVVAGAEVKEIRIAETAGFAGESFSQCVTINVRDAYADPRFNREVDRRTGFRTETILCCPIRRPDGTRVGVIQALNKRRGPFDPVDEAMLEVFSGQAAITLQNALAEEALQKARAKEEELTHKLAENHAKLQTAFRDLNAQKENLETLLHRQRVRRRLAAGAAALVALIAASLLVVRRPAGQTTAAAATAAGEAVAEVRVMQASVTLVGTLEPIRTTVVTSPFTGRVRRLQVKPGDRVTAGQSLAEIDTAQLDNELRELENRHLEATARLAELSAWASSRDVSNARRALARSRAELERAKVNAANTELLFSRGVVSENERRTAQEAVGQLEAQIVAGEEDLVATLKRGDEATLRMARNTHESLTRELERKQAGRGRATIKAEHAGVILRPPTAQGTQERLMTAGRDLSEGEQVLLLGRTDGFRVRATVDEADVLQLKPGQPVVGTGPAFPGVALMGEIAMVSLQGQPESGVSRFDLEVVFPVVSEADRARVLLGMSVDLRVEVYNNPQALVVPIAAVQGFEGAYSALLKLPDGRTEARAVRTGLTSQATVEILDGLKAGDRVVLFR